MRAPSKKKEVDTTREERDLQYLCLVTYTWIDESKYSQSLGLWTKKVSDMEVFSWAEHHRLSKVLFTSYNIEKMEIFRAIYCDVPMIVSVFGTLPDII